MFPAATRLDTKSVAVLQEEIFGATSIPARTIAGCRKLCSKLTTSRKKTRPLGLCRLNAWTARTTKPRSAVSLAGSPKRIVPSKWPFRAERARGSPARALHLADEPRSRGETSWTEECGCHVPRAAGIPYGGSSGRSTRSKRSAFPSCYLIPCTLQDHDGWLELERCRAALLLAAQHLEPLQLSDQLNQPRAIDSGPTDAVSQKVSWTWRKAFRLTTTLCVLLQLEGRLGLPDETSPTF